MTSAFTYRNGMLHAENVSLETIAAEVGTPCYVYSATQLAANYKAFADALAEFKPTIFYAVKTNHNLAVLSLLANCGAGGDIVSVGELERAMQAGIKPEKIVFSSVGKTRDEIKAALTARIHQLNAESIPELKLIGQIATELKLTAPVAIRVNPDVDPLTFKEVSTGQEETKFGIGRVQLDEAVKLATTLPGLSFKGFAVHIGSQLTDFEPFRLAFKFVADIVRHYRAQGITISRIDLGGGIGIPYQPDQKIPPLKTYADIVRETVGNLDCELGFEPGRVIAGTAGVLISRVIYAKKTAGKRFLVVDAGMNDLVRPAMYGAYHGIVPVKEFAKSAPHHPWDVVGAICETGDLFAEGRQLPDLASDDLVVFSDAGAHGSVMSSLYNAKPLAPEVMVSGSRYAVVRRRISVADQMSWESLPPWAKLAKTG